ncbi:MAG TPA: hypothetical protein ENL01_04745 [Chlorobaculum parvum]|uniref:Uncharacterized protein n=1 Tax=Chlorobaculum parvum TaxID=274539 RepID=A0A7C5DCI6_9CHLB|nr:hypothetical protein [Chlorobaculum parvum]
MGLFEVVSRLVEAALRTCHYHRLNGTMLFFLQVLCQSVSSYQNVQNSLLMPVFADPGGLGCAVFLKKSENSANFLLKKSENQL